MRACFHLVAGLLCVVLLASSGSAQVCTIDFEATCPNTTPECGATFGGGLGCRVAGLPFCYSSGSRSYEADANNPVTITLSTAVVEVNVFFAHTGTAQGTMTFWDATTGGNMVGTPIQTNGDCAAAMPPLQNRVFATSIRRIQVDVSGGGSVWIDDLTLTESTVPVAPLPWSHVKVLYKD